MMDGGDGGDGDVKEGQGRVVRGGVVHEGEKGVGHSLDRHVHRVVDLSNRLLRLVCWIAASRAGCSVHSAGEGGPGGVG